jgi:hypothetical protein
VGRQAPRIYRIVEYDFPHSVTLFGANATVVSRDTITCETTDAEALSPVEPRRAGATVG